MKLPIHHEIRSLCKNGSCDMSSFWNIKKCFSITQRVLRWTTGKSLSTILLLPSSNLGQKICFYEEQFQRRTHLHLRTKFFFIFSSMNDWTSWNIIVWYGIQVSSYHYLLKMRFFFRKKNDVSRKIHHNEMISINNWKKYETKNLGKMFWKFYDFFSVNFRANDFVAWRGLIF